MKKILLINGHPNPDSFNTALLEAYQKGFASDHVAVEVLTIGTLDFEPSLKYGYHQRMELEPDLVRAQKLIAWADHLVWFHPVWWGGLPAVTKGFIDRVFLPGFAFKYRENSPWWDKLLTGKTARIITTLDQPSFFYRLVFRRPSVNQLKRSTLQFCGIKPVKVTYIGIVKSSSAAQRVDWLKKMQLLAQKDTK